MDNTNILLKNPLQIIRLPPINNPKNGRVNTLLGGGLPVNIFNAIKNKKNDVVKSYFGRHWKESIGLETPKLTVGGGDVCIGADEPSFYDIEKLINEEQELNELEKEQLLDIPVNVPVATKKTSFSGITKMASADVPLPDNGTDYEISAIAVFPEDRMYELKEKIYVSTGVPVQRQHIFWIDDNNSARTTYKMKTSDGGEIYIDARQIVKTDSIQEKKPAGKSSAIFGLEIDKYLYDNSESITVVAMDTFKTVEDYILGVTSIIYVVDLADVLYNDDIRFTISNDKNLRDLLYRSVIFKYWPWITEDIFSMAINNEQELAINYPQLAPNRANLERKFMAESSILSHVDPSAKNNLNMAITMAVTSVSTGTRINIRNLFDKMETSKDCPHVSAYIADGALRYNVVKHHIGTPSAIFPPQTRSGITMAIPVNPDDLYSRSVSRQTVAESVTGSKKTYLFLNLQSDGIYYILSHWNDDENVDFDTLISVFAERVNPIIDQINTYKDYIFMGTIKRMAHVSKVNARYPDINISLTWKRPANEGDFKILKELWQPYEEAGMIKINPIKFGAHQGAMMEMNLFKGCVEYDINQIAKSSVLSKIKNYYIYLTDPTTNQVWNNMYRGRLIRMNQRTSDIQFELFNMTQNNFLKFQTYLNLYINNIKRNHLLPEKSVFSRKVVKKLKALQETDPELYDLRKHGSNRLYAVLCQEQRQPGIDNSPRKGSTEYFNYTTGKKSYYYCDNPDYPVMSFIAGVHPKGYCLPCCKKIMAVEGTEKSKEHYSCLEHGTIVEAEKVDIGKIPANSSRHIMTFGKELPKYRLGLPPKEVVDFITTIIGEQEEGISFYTYGVDQNYPGATGASGAGALAALAMPIKKKPAELAAIFVRYLKLMGAGYESLLNGEIIESFDSVDSLINTIFKIFIAGEIGVIYFDKWMELFAELFRLIQNIEVVIMSQAEIIYSGSADDVGRQTIILIRFDDFIYPLVRLNIDEYFRSGSVTYPIFKENIPAMLDQMTGKVTDDKYDLSHLLEIVKDIGSFKLCITTQRIAYGLLFDNVFITFKPTSIPKGITTFDGVPSAGKEAESLSLMKKINSVVKGNLEKTDEHITIFIDKTPIVRAHISDNQKDVWAAVLAGRNNDLDTDLSKIALSKHNNYNLFVMEFVFWADKHKNTKIRNKLKTLINELNINDINSFHEFTHNLKEIIDSAADVGFINNVIAQNLSNKKKIIEVIDSVQLNFDKNNYDEMHKMTIDEVKEIIKEFVSKCIEKIEDLPPAPDNLTLPKSILKKKLMIKSADLDSMTELLISDIQNPLKLELMKSGALSSYLLLDIFEFERRPNETIKVIQV